MVGVQTSRCLTLVGAGVAICDVLRWFLFGLGEEFVLKVGFDTVGWLSRGKSCLYSMR